MRVLQELFRRNREWAASMTAQDPEFFAKLAQQQTPRYLWIGCSDSRVPANQIVGMMPGEVFVHRNVANLVVHTDFNCLSVLQFAIELLHVEHVIVCGHYGCGGVRAAFEDHELGLIDNWLRHIKAVDAKHRAELDASASAQARLDRLCELNVREQVLNVGSTTIVQRAWRQGQRLSVHGWIYGIQDGLLRDLDLCVASREDLEAIDASA
ncbi:MAG: carbonate dehydratase [Planctomycetota bacterium]